MPSCRSSACCSRSLLVFFDDTTGSTPRASGQSHHRRVDLSHDGGALSDVSFLSPVAAGLVAGLWRRRALCDVLGVTLVFLLPTQTRCAGDCDRMYPVHVRFRVLSVVATTLADAISLHCFWSRIAGQPIHLERYPALFHRRSLRLVNVAVRLTMDTCLKNIFRRPNE